MSPTLFVGASHKLGSSSDNRTKGRYAARNATKKCAPKVGAVDNLKAMLETLPRRLAEIAFGLVLVAGPASAGGRPAPDAVIIYPPNSESISSSDGQALEILSAGVKAGETQWVSLEAYADDQGSRELNIALAQRRIEDVSRHLVQLGVPANRIHGTSYGEEHMDESVLPMRRVEIRLSKQRR